MNTVLSNYGQLCGCPEILKKSCNFFVVGLTYGCRRSCTRGGVPSSLEMCAAFMCFFIIT